MVVFNEANSDSFIQIFITNTISQITYYVSNSKYLLVHVYM